MVKYLSDMNKILGLIPNTTNTNSKNKKQKMLQSFPLPRTLHRVPLTNTYTRAPCEKELWQVLEVHRATSLHPSKQLSDGDVISHIFQMKVGEGKVVTKVARPGGKVTDIRPMV